MTEAEAAGFTTAKDGDTGTISEAGSTASFTNTRATGGLEVRKTVVSDLAADKDAEFAFTVTLGDATIAGEYGDMTFEGGVATLRLKDGGSATATGLPTTLSYKVTETVPAGFLNETPEVQGSVVEDADPEAEGAQPSVAAFANTRETGSLAISKVLDSGLGADKDQAFTFGVKLSDASIGAEYAARMGDGSEHDPVKFADGEASVTLKGGETIVIDGLPTTVGYTVTETVPDGFTNASPSKSGTVTADGSTASFTNTRRQLHQRAQYGNAYRLQGARLQASERHEQGLLD